MHATASIDETGGLTISGVTDPVPWWSFTKTVLCVAALRLVENGSLTLDDALAGEKFSLRQLLRHEAGLPDYGAIARYHDDVADGKAPWPVDRLLAAAQAGRLRYEPGTGWAYSNIGYLKVAELIEQVSGQRLAGALAELVFEPAGTKTARLALTPEDLVNVEMGNANYRHVICLLRARFWGLDDCLQRLRRVPSRPHCRSTVICSIVTTRLPQTPQSSMMRPPKRHHLGGGHGAC